MSCTAAEEGLVAGPAWTEGEAAEEAAEEGIVEGWRLERKEGLARGFMAWRSWCCTHVGWCILAGLRGLGFNLAPVAFVKLLCNRNTDLKQAALTP